MCEWGDVSEATIAALAGIIVALGLRLIDALLPKGYHVKFVERFMVPDDPDDPAAPEDEEG